MPSAASTNDPFAPCEQDPRTPKPPKWDGRKDALPEPQYLPQFKNYQFRYGAYPGYRDCSENPPWPDGAVSEHARRQESPIKYVVGRPGRTTFKPNERVCGDLQFGKPKAKAAHEDMWYRIKDPDYYNLKSKRWDVSGVKRIPPRPFYNREDGHFLLNNTCTIANLCLLPELRRLQCYFFPKLPKIRKDRNFYLPMKKHGRQHTRWRWTETWKRQLIPWYTNYGPEEPEIAQCKEAERLELDKKHTRWHYFMNKESIETLRAWHRRVKVKTPPPKTRPIDYHTWKRDFEWCTKSERTF
ncbi:hypothetical protein KC19_10G030100 [Ceratodon purpureus]|uniref:Uncharacterized protein n=1 Tax=Ceratodon purpureus TaxID=3225 RepID=A0A8T0GGL5_CERPU|nr:hypothetical protein KC19_10G030100 [Ceratodon purpureus]